MQDQATRRHFLALAGGATWLLENADPATKIGRPRQLYTGATHRDYVPVDKR